MNIFLIIYAVINLIISIFALTWLDKADGLFWNILSVFMFLVVGTPILVIELINKLIINVTKK